MERAKSFIDQINTATGGLITDYWVCPHIESPYRKPNPGMITGLAYSEAKILLTEDKDFGRLVYAHAHPSGGVILIRFPSKYSVVVCPATSQTAFTLGGQPAASCGNWSHIAWPWH